MCVCVYIYIYILEVNVMTLGKSKCCSDIWKCWHNRVQQPAKEWSLYYVNGAT